MARQVFRKSLLEKMSSPDQLDKMIVITTPSSWLALLGGAIIVVVVLIWSVYGHIPVNMEANGIFISDQKIVHQISDKSGVVSTLDVKIGDTVEVGDVLMMLKDEASREVVVTPVKEEENGVIPAIEPTPEPTGTPVYATVSGTVADINVGIGSVVEQGAEVMSIRYFSGEKHIICYIPITSSKKVEPGMEVIVCPTNVNQQEYGHMQAEVVSVDQYVTPVSSIHSTLGDETLTQYFTQTGPVVGVTCKIRPDETTASGYWWSNHKGAELLVAEGTIVSMDIITEKKAPITMVIPHIKEKFAMTAYSVIGNGWGAS